jgi:serine/threonine protein kinase/tetratricopeptide (TPR) repeat protein
MTPERWQQVKTALDAALQLETSQRSAYLDALGAQDVSLRHEVESLLAAGQDVQTRFLESPPAERVLLAEGSKLGPYEIVSSIGAGGMGEVYRAHDARLSRDVAIKVLPRVFCDDAERLGRFQQEARAAAALNHPNILVIYDFGTAEGLPFVVSELLEGETLRDGLRAGPLPVEKAVQIVSGLSAAHDKGIVHRDLKPENLFLTKEGRVKILDFGLAKLLRREKFNLHESPTLASETIPGVVMGTMGYMSPEQVRGQAVDYRSDLFAFGAVLYEMLSGKRAFQGATPADTISAILTHNPAALAEDHPTVPPALDGVVRRCLEKEASQRYQSAHELRADLERLAAARTQISPRPDWQWVLALSVVLAVAVTSSWYVLNRRPAKVISTPPAVPVHARRSVAVLGFKNLSGKPDAAWLSTALSEMLTTELAAGEKLRTVPGETVAQAKASLALPDAESFGKETLTKIRQNLESDDVVLGSYMPLGGGLIRVDVWLQDTVAGETLATISEKGSEAQLDELANKAGAELRAKLGIGSLSEEEAAGVRASLPTNPEAGRLYSEGLAKLRLFDYLGARELLQKAVAAEPGYALGHSALSDAWLGLGYQEKAREEAKRAVDRGAALPSAQRLWIEGHYRETTREFDKAVEAYSQLLTAAPDDIESGLRLAAAQTSASKANDSLTTIQKLRNLPSPLKDDPRIDLAEAVAAESVSDFKRESSLATRAAATATAQGARLLLARARLTECSALEYLHDLKTAMGACEEAKTIYASAGNPQGSATALLNIGNVLADQGDLDRANQAYGESMKISRQLGSLGSTAAALNNIATNLTEEGDSAGALRMYREALAIKRAVGAKAEIARTLYNIGNVLMAQGALAEAQKTYDESLAISQTIGDKEGVANAELNMAELLRKQGALAEAKRRYDESRATYDQTQDEDGIAYALVGTAEVLAVQGDLSGAEKTYEQALAIAQKLDDKHETAFALAGLGDVLLARGDLSGARSRYEEALSIRKGLGEKPNVAEVQLALAAVALEEGHPAAAQAAIPEIVQQFRKQKLRDDEILSDALLAEALLASGDVLEARKQADAAVSLAAKSQSRELRWRAGTVEASALVSTSKQSEITLAAKHLETVAAEAAKDGFLQEQFDSRLALGEIEMKSGKTAAGRARLAALENEATRAGFLLIARKAHRSAGDGAGLNPGR